MTTGYESNGDCRCCKIAPMQTAWGLCKECDGAVERFLAVRSMNLDARIPYSIAVAVHT